MVFLPPTSGLLLGPAGRPRYVGAVGEDVGLSEPLVATVAEDVGVGARGIGAFLTLPVVWAVGRVAVGLKVPLLHCHFSRRTPLNLVPSAFWSMNCPVSLLRFTKRSSPCTFVLSWVRLRTAPFR